MTPIQPLEQLVRQARGGDRAATDALVSRCMGLVLGVTRSILRDPASAEDAAQDAWLIAWERLDQLSQPRAFPGWLRRIAVSCALKQRSSSRELLLQDLNLPEPAAPRPDTQPAPHVFGALDALDARHRLALALQHWGELPLKSIARELGVSVPVVKKLLFEARKQLGDALADPTQDELPAQHSLLVAKVQLFLSLRSGDLPAIERQLDARPHLINTLDIPDEDPSRWYLPSRGGSTPLSWAIDRADRPLVAALLARGADPQLMGSGRLTPLYMAVCGGDLEIVRLLLDADAAINAPNPTTLMTPLHAAMIKCAAPIIALLLERGADPHAPDRFGRTPEAWANLKTSST